MSNNEMTVRDLARITLRVAAASNMTDPVLELAVGHVHQAYLPFIKAGKDERIRHFLPFTKAEWEVLIETDRLWEVVKSEVGIHDDPTLRVSIPRASIPLAAWNANMVGGIAQTLCFGQAMLAFGITNKE